MPKEYLNVLKDMKLKIYLKLLNKFKANIELKNREDNLRDFNNQNKIDFRMIKMIMKRKDNLRDFIKRTKETESIYK